MSINYERLEEFIITANLMKEKREKEDQLRHNLTYYLPLIFTDEPKWIHIHTKKVESNMMFRIDGKQRYGFSDALVGNTVFEYERDLLLKSNFEQGYNQVKDYCAGLINSGSKVSDIVGILSDTVIWYAYRCKLKNSNNLVKLYGRDDIELELISEITLNNSNAQVMKSFLNFVEKYFARKGIRRLDAISLKEDLGFGSIFCKNYISDIKSIVNKAFKDRPKYAELIKGLWQELLSNKMNSENKFNLDNYINEFYIITISKFICANILNMKPLVSDDDEIKDILTGQYFKGKGLLNFIEYDYFGWINDTPYIEDLVFICREIQSDLSVYEYDKPINEDVFGNIVAELAQRDNKLLLGQEYTPSWLANRMTKEIIKNWDVEKSIPKVLDMCCGSGVFIVEVLREISKKIKEYDDINKKNIDDFRSCVVGFDIDPLAVMISKVNWVIGMSPYLGLIDGDIIIPIYNADSLFISTPVTHIIDEESMNESIELKIGTQRVLLPSFIIMEYESNLFDTIIEKTYSLAVNKKIEIESQLDKGTMYELLKDVLISTGVSDSKINEIVKFSIDLTKAIRIMHNKDENGIWSFILSNSYRPALLRNSFDVIISNPPWLAMSKIQNNPYKKELEKRSKKYNIQTVGSSHPHLELAVIFLVQSVDYYLGEKGYFSCILPETILNGYNNENFRRVLINDDSNIHIDKLHRIDGDVFKNKAIAIYGNNFNLKVSEKNIPGSLITKLSEEEKMFKYIYNGKRSAITDNELAENIIDIIEPVKFLQGADIMPRSLYFHNIVEDNGKINVYPIDRKDENYYLIQQSKKYKDFKLNVTNLDKELLYRCVLSNHVLPYFVYEPSLCILPVKYDKDREEWDYLSELDKLKFNITTQSAIDKILKKEDMTLEEIFDKKINLYNKLKNQRFDDDWLVVSGAGGSIVCAGILNIEDINDRPIIVDQTLYWHKCDSKEEALYISGMLNSSAITKLISEFQPEGLMGKRHIHTLPYKLIPKFVGSDEQLEIAYKVNCLINNINKDSRDDIKEIMNPNSGTLQRRRRQFRKHIEEKEEFIVLENLCETYLGVN